jgi:hypothetical protein
VRLYIWTRVTGVLYPRDRKDVACVVAVARSVLSARAMLQTRANELRSSERDPWAAPSLKDIADYSTKVDDTKERVWVFPRATEYGGD